MHLIVAVVCDYDDDGVVQTQCRYKEYLHILYAAALLNTKFYFE